jgi:hypothetical protein
MGGALRKEAPNRPVILCCSPLERHFGLQNPRNRHVIREMNPGQIIERFKSKEPRNGNAGEADPVRFTGKISGLLDWCARQDLKDFEETAEMLCFPWFSGVFPECFRGNRAIPRRNAVWIRGIRVFTW